MSDKKTMKLKLILGAAALGLAASTQAATITPDVLTAIGGSPEGGYVYAIQNTGAGVGNFNAFLLLDESGQGDGVESGFNTSNNALRTPDTKPQSTDILASLVPIVMINGSQYYQIALDVNETGSENPPLITLQSLGFRVGALQTTTTFVPEVTLNGPLSVGGVGSGESDLLIYVPLAPLGAPGAGQYFYLNATISDVSSGYEGFGTADPFTPPGQNVPDAASTMALVSMGLAAVGVARRIRRA